jgi:hypothetical protein
LSFLQGALLCLPLQAQTLNSVSFCLLDAKTNKAVLYANVVVLGTSRGTFSDSDGCVQLYMSKEDTIAISAVGYTTKKVGIDELPDAGTIYLLPQEVFLNEVEIEGNRNFQFKHFAHHKNKPKGAFGASIASLRYFSIPSDTQYLLEQATIRFSALGINKRNPILQNNKPMLVRLLVLATDSASTPGNNILNKDIVQRIEPKQKFVRFQVPPLALPENGVFVGVEFIGYYNDEELIPFKETNLNRLRQFMTALATDSHDTHSWVRKNINSNWERTGNFDQIYNFCYGIKVAY